MPDPIANALLLTDATQIMGPDVARKPKSKLPAGWDVYSSSNRKPPRRKWPGWLKYVPWAALLGALAILAFYPWRL